MSSYEFDTPGSVSLHVRLPSGRVVVAAADGPRTSVELVALGRRGSDSLEEVEVRCEEHTGGHKVTVQQGPRFRWGPIQISWDDAIEARITCPPGTDVEITTASANVEAGDGLGDVAVKTASGDVALGSADGTVSVKTASGDVSFAELSKEATLTTVSGDIDGRAVRSQLSGKTVSGDVRLRLVEAPVTLSSTSGDVEIDAITGGEARVQTISGDVRVGVGRGTRVWIDAASVSGKLDSQLGLEDELGTAPDGGAAVPLHVKTVSGDVRILRAAAQAHAAA